MRKYLLLIALLGISAAALRSDTVYVDGVEQGKISGGGGAVGVDSVAREAIDTHVEDTDNPHEVTPEQIGAATLGDITEHNIADDAHDDIRQLIRDIPYPPQNTANGWLVWDAGSNVYWRVTVTNLRFYVHEAL